MDKEFIRNLEETYINLEEDANEADIGKHIVDPLLIKLGYLSGWIHYQKRKIKGKLIFDAIISPKKDKCQKVIVEFKNKKTKIGLNEILQISTYINSVADVEFGIITNGRDLLLISNSIIGELEQRIIFKIDIYNDKCNWILDFLGYECVLNNQVTKYFRDLAQFKAFFLEEKKETSWSRYDNTLSNFYCYLSERKKYYSPDKLRVDDFNEFLESKKDSKKSSFTLLNNYSHISALYEDFKKNDLVKENPFERIVDEYREKSYKIQKEPLQNHEIDIILDALKLSNNPQRNVLIFKLILFSGMNRSDIQHFETSRIDTIRKLLFLNKNKVIPITENLGNEIETYLKLKKDKGLSSIYLFSSNYGENKNKSFDAGQFDDILKTALKKTSLSKERQKEITIKFIKECLVVGLYKEGSSKDDIAYLTGLSHSMIKMYTANFDTVREINAEFIIKRHPYKKYF